MRKGTGLMRVLSIDYDYFMKADASCRLGLFPDGGREMGEDLNRIIWSQHYSMAEIYGHPITDIECDEESLSFVRDVALAQKKAVYMFADSHAEIYPFIRYLLSGREKAEVHNIDFHHDAYGEGKKGEVHCGNWLEVLHDTKKLSKAFWVSREESDKDDMPDWIIPEELHDIEGLEFDCVFACRSSWWSPPHLDSKFISGLVDPVRKNFRTVVRSTATVGDRYDDEFRDAVRKGVDFCRPGQRPRKKSEPEAASNR